MPWDEAYTIWANLNIANMDFQDFVVEDIVEGDSGWYQYRSIGSVLTKENIKRKDAELARFERDGLI